MEYITKVNGQTKCDRVVDQIKDLIIRGVYKTGDQLPPEAALCDMFGVSRITVRESLKKLNMMGLVDIRQGKGTYVRNIDLGTFMKPMFQLIDFEQIDVETIYNAREIIEGGIAYLAARNRTDEECDALGDILAHLKDAVRTKDIVLIRGLDSEFHIQLAKMSHNTLLEVKRIDKFFVTLKDNYEEHLAIYEQVRNQNPEGARKAMMVHTVESKKALLE